ncbi:hypothetical protein L2E82_29287 [Cichorium intybus]|uniref:Uncharacterized protein n=1 Tax=Cichorium intybus TaxID=13427 RepID=A0ACB9CXJ7_CICIN|nr:hypothetical protein L2E82_29287 [Cichorium intybus]
MLACCHIVLGQRQSDGNMTVKKMRETEEGHGKNAMLSAGQATEEEGGDGVSGGQRRGHEGHKEGQRSTTRATDSSDGVAEVGIKRDGKYKKLGDHIRNKVII